MLHKVVQVIPYEDYRVYVYFEDGKIVCYDASCLLDKKVFEPLKKLTFFMESCMVLNDTLAWDLSGNRDETQCIDIDPEMLHELPQAVEKIA